LVLVKINETYKDEYHCLTKEEDIELISKYGKSENNKEFLNFVFNSLNKKIDQLENPNVPMTFFYSSNRKTTVGYDLPMNPREITKQNKFVIHELGENVEIFNGGDGTVETASSLIPGLKWASLFENKSSSSKDKPIHFVNYCSKSNKIENIDLNKKPAF